MGSLHAALTLRIGGRALPPLTYPTAMRTPLLVAALAALTLASCSSNDPEDVVLPSRDALVERYGSLAPGTFRVRQPDIKMVFDGPGVQYDEIENSIYLSNHKRLFFMSVRFGSIDNYRPNSDANDGWMGAYGGDPKGSRNCTGMIYDAGSGSGVLRIVFAGRCGKVDPLRGPHDFTLVEGGFAYVR